MAWAKRTDANHSAITLELQRMGWSVVNLSRVGQGCPDILIGAGFYTMLAEIKVEKGKLNERQQDFGRKWMGSPILILRSPEQAVLAVREELKRLWRRAA